jgi:1-acyl-sn-glycerol-3-phosphate acyltransferase
MLRTVGLILFEVFYLIGTLFSRPRLRRLERAGDAAGVRRLIEGVALGWAGATLRHVRADITVEGKENLPPDDTPVVFVANHQSYFDIPLITVGIDRPRPFIAKQEVRRVPIVRGWMDAWHCVFVNRTDARAAAAAFRDAAKEVAGGGSLIVFAEGTRSRDGQVHEFKAGSFRIAQLARAVVVPCCIDGTRAILEGNGMRVKPGMKIRLRILPAVDTSAYTRDDWKALPQTCKEQIETALSEMRGSL